MRKKLQCNWIGMPNRRAIWIEPFILSAKMQEKLLLVGTEVVSRSVVSQWAADGLTTNRLYDLPLSLPFNIGVLLFNTSGDNDALYFRSAFIDLGDLGVAHQAFYVIFLHKPVSAVYLYGFHTVAHGHF